MVDSLFGGSSTTTTKPALTPAQQALLKPATQKGLEYAGQNLRWPTAGGRPAPPGLSLAQQKRLAGLENIAKPGGASLNPAQQAKMNQLLGIAKAHKTGGTKPQPIPSVAPIQPSQTAGANQAIADAGTQTQIAQNAANLQAFLTNPNLLNPATNPAEQAAIDAATKPIYQQLTEATLPALRSGAAGAGQYGSSRQGIAEGLASQAASQAAGMTGAQISNADYQAGLDAMTRAMGISPSIGTEQTQGATTTSGAGDYLQNLQTQQDQERLQRAFYNMGLPLSQAQNLTNLAAAQPGAGVTAQATGSPSLFNTALGGASLGSGIAPLLGMSGAAGGGIGAALMPLLQILMG